MSASAGHRGGTEELRDDVAVAIERDLWKQGQGVGCGAVRELIDCDERSLAL